MALSLLLAHRLVPLDKNSYVGLCGTLGPFGRPPRVACQRHNQRENP